MTTIHLRKGMNEIGKDIKARAIRMAPVDQGQLRKTFDFRIEGDKIIFFTETTEAADMEWGRPPSGDLSEDEKQSLTDWAKRHKASPARIIKYIEEKGIKIGTPEAPLHITSYGRDSYRPFLRPAIYMHIPVILDKLKANIVVSRQ